MVEQGGKSAGERNSPAEGTVGIHLGEDRSPAEEDPDDSNRLQTFQRWIEGSRDMIVGCAIVGIQNRIERYGRRIARRLGVEENDRAGLQLESGENQIKGRGEQRVLYVLETPCETPLQGSAREGSADNLEQWMGCPNVTTGWGSRSGRVAEWPSGLALPLLHVASRLFPSADFHMCLYITDLGRGAYLQQLLHLSTSFRDSVTNALCSQQEVPRYMYYEALKQSDSRR